MNRLVMIFFTTALIALTAIITAYAVTATYEIDQSRQADYTLALMRQNAALQAEIEQGYAIGQGLTMKPLGEFEVTHYCYNSGTTASGTVPNEATIAVDPDVIPLGSLVYMGADYGFKIALDTGKAVKIKTIDVYNPDYEECINLGRVKNVKVWIVESEE